MSQSPIVPHRSNAFPQKASKHLLVLALWKALSDTSGKAISQPVHRRHSARLRGVAVADIGQDDHPDLAAALPQLVQVGLGNRGPDDLVIGPLRKKDGDSRSTPGCSVEKEASRFALGRILHRQEQFARVASPFSACLSDRKAL